MILYLNLLPREERKKIKVERRYRFIKKEALLLVVLTLVVSFVTFYIKEFVEGNIQEIATQLQETKATNRPIIVEIQTVNNSIGQFKKLQAGYTSKSHQLVEFASRIPVGITLTQFSFEQNNRVIVRGKYDRRDTILEFKEVMEAEFLDDLQFPIANLLKQTDGDFTLEGVLQEVVQSHTHILVEHNHELPKE